LRLFWLKGVFRSTPKVVEHGYSFSFAF